MLTLDTAANQLTLISMKIAEVQRGTDPSDFYVIPIATIILASLEAWAARTAEAKKLKNIEILMFLAALAEFLVLINAGPESYGLALLHAVTFFGVYAYTDSRTAFKKNK